MGEITHDSKSAAGTYEEWRVSGQPGSGYPQYDFVWSPLLNPHLGEDAERSARHFAESVVAAPARTGGIRSPWVDGPHLSKRTVTITDWAPVPSSPEETPR